MIANGDIYLSRPMRARGLKQDIMADVLLLILSRPMRARGLKQIRMVSGLTPEQVAPHAGAWIETAYFGNIH